MIYTQSEVYSDLGQPLLEKALEGYNATIFAYGQVRLDYNYWYIWYTVVIVSFK